MLTVDRCDGNDGEMAQQTKERESWRPQSHQHCSELIVSYHIDLTQVTIIWSSNLE